jgi:hypothetical protein
LANVVRVILEPSHQSQEISMTRNGFLSLATRKAFGAAMIAGVMVCAPAIIGSVQAAEIRHQDSDHLKPNGRGAGEHDASGATAAAASRFSSVSTNGINYHGGPIMPGAVNLYYIWYGAWNFSSTPPDTSKTILETFATQIGGTPYFNINKTYTDSTPAAVSGSVKFVKSIIDTGSQGAALSDASVGNIVANAISSGKLPVDDNGVYFVLTSPEVNETSGFCTQYCAWHTYGTLNSHDIKYGFVGSPARCPSACSAQSTSPNGNMAADGMANLIAHELSESVSDPKLNAWFDRRGMENADKCAWTFGTTKTASNGSQYNVTFGTTSYLLQRNWLNAKGGLCTLSN